MTASARNEGISLTGISPSTKSNTEPKGLAPYNPYAKTELLAARIIERYALLRDQDALPAGPRTIGYRLKETYRGQYDKADFPNIDRIIKRRRHLGLTPEMALERAETAGLEDDDCAAIVAYAASGTGLWDRDVSLLDGVAKFSVRQELISEIRQADDATAARADALLARGREGREHT